MLHRDSLPRFLYKIPREVPFDGQEREQSLNGNDLVGFPFVADRLGFRSVAYWAVVCTFVYCRVRINCWA